MIGGPVYTLKRMPEPRHPIREKGDPMPRISRSSKSLLAILLTLSLAFAAVIQAQDDSAPLPDFRQSLGISPFLFLGGLGGNYEFLASPRHGLMAEGAYQFAGAASGSYNAGLGYRFHFTPSMESGFLGAFARYGFIHAEAKGEVNDKTTTYKYESPFLLLGANIGTKWQWANGVALTLRGGYGFPVYTDFTWTPTDPEPKFIKTLVETLVGLDLEFSVGYSF